LKRSRYERTCRLSYPLVFQHRYWT
jgi:hypothetical protein